MVKHNENGLLVQAKDQVLLSQAIVQVIKSPKQADDLADNAFQFAKNNYSNNTMLGRYNKLFNA